MRDGVQGTNFWSEYNRLGGPSTLGYPISRPYWQDGFLQQVFQNAILQWRPDQSLVVIANSMDWLYKLGKEDFLVSRGIPRQLSVFDAGNPMLRLSWLTDQAIAAIYFTSPDPLPLYGLPTSMPQQMGSLIAQRFQKTVLMRNPDGSVVGLAVGDLVKGLGIIPTDALVPQSP